MYVLLPTWKTTMFGLNAVLQCELNCFEVGDVLDSIAAISTGLAIPPALGPIIVNLWSSFCCWGLFTHQLLSGLFNFRLWPSALLRLPV